MLYHSYVGTPDTVNQLFVDPMLSNPAGHTVLAETLAAYFQSQACQVWASVTSHDLASTLEPVGLSGGALGGVGIRKGDIGGNAGAGASPHHKEPYFGSSNDLVKPPPFMTDTRHGDLNGFREIEPFCVSANDLINPLPPSLFSGSGWHAFHPHGSHDAAARHDGTENEHYWYSTLPTSRLKVPVRLGAGDVGVYYMREPVAEDRNSVVHCYVDDNYGGAVRIPNADPKIGSPKPG